MAENVLGVPVLAHQQSPPRILLTVLFILVFGFDHVDQLVVRLDWILHVEILSRSMFLLQHRLDQVL